MNLVITGPELNLNHMAGVEQSSLTSLTYSKLVFLQSGNLEFGANVRVELTGDPCEHVQLQYLVSCLLPRSESMFQEKYHDGILRPLAARKKPHTAQSNPEKNNIHE